MFSCFPGSFKQERVLLFPSVSLPDGETTHGYNIVSLPAWVQGPCRPPWATTAATAANHHTCSLTGVVDRKNQTNIHQLFDARFYLFTRPMRGNRFVRGLVGSGRQ